MTKHMDNLKKILTELRGIYDSFDMKPIACEYGRQGESSFKILVSTILSLRTKDPVTFESTERLWKVAQTPEEMLSLAEEKLAELIYPVGFYRRKAKQIQQISQIMIDDYKGEVPNTAAKLKELPGVGLKTANLVAGICFGEPAICVDIHVHRISNRLGWVKTDTPAETEKALMKVLPQEYWIEINDLLVAYGQNICTPMSPYCESKCKMADYCPKSGVRRQR